MNRSLIDKLLKDNPSLKKYMEQDEYGIDIYFVEKDGFRTKVDSFTYDQIDFMSKLQDKLREFKRLYGIKIGHIPGNATKGV